MMKEKTPFIISLAFHREKKRWFNVNEESEGTAKSLENEEVLMSKSVLFERHKTFSHTSHWRRHTQWTRMVTFSFLEITQRKWWAYFWCSVRDLRDASDQLGVDHPEFWTTLWCSFTFLSPSFSSSRRLLEEIHTKMKIEGKIQQSQ